MSRKYRKPFLDDDGFAKLNLLNDVSNHHNILANNDILSDNKRTKLLKDLRQQNLISAKVLLNKDNVKCYQLHLTETGRKVQNNLQNKADKQIAYNKSYVHAFKTDSYYGYLIAIIVGILFIVGIVNGNGYLGQYRDGIAWLCLIGILVVCPIAFSIIKRLVGKHFHV